MQFRRQGTKGFIKLELKKYISLFCSIHSINFY